MKTYSDKFLKRNHLFGNFIDICRCVAFVLVISNGEFGAWYG